MKFPKIEPTSYGALFPPVVLSCLSEYCLLLIANFIFLKHKTIPEHAFCIDAVLIFHKLL